MKIGDRLLVTKEYVDWYRTVNDVPVLQFEINEILEVHEVTQSGKVRAVSDSTVGGFIDLPMAQRMKVAYQKNEITDIDEMERCSYIRRNHGGEHNTFE